MSDAPSFLYEDSHRLQNNSRVFKSLRTHQESSSDQHFFGIARPIFVLPTSCLTRFRKRPISLSMGANVSELWRVRSIHLTWPSGLRLL